MAGKDTEAFTFQPLTPATWESFELLFGPNGACGGCWCMTWRLMKADYEKSKGAGNRKKMKQIVAKHEPVGVLAFDGDVPVGWCAVAPREKYPRLTTSRAMKSIDDKRVWTISCFFIARPYRRKGLSVKLLRAAVVYAAGLGASAIEAFPADPGRKELVDTFAWTGILASFLAAGFKEEARQTPSRPTVRYYVRPKPQV